MDGSPLCWRGAAPTGGEPQLAEAWFGYRDDGELERRMIVAQASTRALLRFSADPANMMREPAGFSGRLAAAIKKGSASMGSTRFSMRISLVLFGITALALVPTSVASSAAHSVTCSICGSNLILNAGAEAGLGTISDSVVVVPDWTRERGSFTAASYSWSGGDLSATTPGPPNRGKNYFYGGPNPANGKAVGEGTQTVSLSQAAAAIATGKATATLSGWLGGLSSQEDNAQLSATFLSASGKILGVFEIGPVPAVGKEATASALILRRNTDIIPKGTTSARVALVLTRYDGSDNDGMADNVSLTLAE